LYLILHFKAACFIKGHFCQEISDFCTDVCAFFISFSFFSQANPVAFNIFHSSGPVNMKVTKDACRFLFYDFFKKHFLFF